MSSIGDLRITVADVNYLLGNAGSSKRLHVTRSYNRVRIELLDDNGALEGMNQTNQMSLIDLI